MGTKAGVGCSFNRNPAEAGNEAALKALERAGIERPDFVFAFATVGYDQVALLRSIREATSAAPLSGCSGEGIITQDTVVETNFGVCVMVIKSDELRFSNISVKGIGDRSDIAGERLANGIRAFLADDSIACFLMADGLAFNFDSFLSGFNNTLDREKLLPLYGGLAADDGASHKTFQYHNDEVISEGISCVLMSGSRKVAFGINHGCVPVGSRRMITRCTGNVIYEIDGIPALEALKDYFPEDWEQQWNKTSLNLCLGFKSPEHIKIGYEDYIIRYMMAKNDQQGSVTIQSEIEAGTELWLVRRDKELITSGIQMISRHINEQLDGVKPKFVFQFECVGRGKVVFREREKVQLIKSLQMELGEDIPWIGLYTYGEIGPVANSNYFHNFTSVIVAVY